MSDKILQKYMGKTSNGGIEVARPAEIEDVEDFDSFGWLRDSRTRALMLELRKNDGNILAVGYGWLEKVAFDPSVGITLHFVGQHIRITGRNLNGEAAPHARLFQGITRHRVAWIEEADDATAFQAGKYTTVIETIDW